MTAAILEEFRRHADDLPIFVWMQRPDGRIEWANRTWHDYVALPPDAATTPEGWAQVVHPDDLALMLETAAAAIVDASTYESEYRVKPVTADESGYRWILARATPQFDAHGRITHWLALGTDIQASRVRADARAAVLADVVKREHRLRLRERHIAQTFQQAALQARIPQVMGLSFDAIYVPGRLDALVGGDWFDAFRLVDGRVVFSVGDVAGSGLQAAVTMGSLRQSIRTAALINPDPVAVLDAVDRIVRDMNPDLLATAFIAVFDPVHAELRYASAGHPPPLLRRPDGTIEALEMFALPLGLRQRTFEPAATVSIEPGALLVMYTDGLTESTRDPLAGEAALVEALNAASDSSTPAHAVYRAVVEPAGPRDDVAILTVRFDEHMTRGDGCYGVWNWTFDATDAAAASKTRLEIGAILRAAGMCEDDVTNAELVFAELIGNVLRHASRTVRVALDRTGEHAVLHVFDEGRGFEHNPRLPGDLLAERGRGLYIVSHLSEELSITRRTEGGSHMRAVLMGKTRRP